MLFLRWFCGAFGVVFLWWCFGGVSVMVCDGGVFVGVFVFLAFGVVGFFGVFLWWSFVLFLRWFCGAFGVVFLWWCFGGVSVMVCDGGVFVGFFGFLVFGVVGLFGCVFVVVFCAVSVVVLVVVWWRYFLVCFCGVLCFFCGDFGGGGVVRAQRLPLVRSLQESCVSMQT